MEQSPQSDEVRTTRVRRRRLLQTVGGVGAIGFAGCLSGDDDSDDGNGDDNGNGDDTDPGADDPWEGYEPSGEPPERVDPPEDGGLSGDPPSDATVLWDGETATLDDWEHLDGRDAEWIEHDDYFEVDTGTGDLRPREAMGDCQLHVEWRNPEAHADIDGSGQWPGNSGLFMMESYEFQILQSYDNQTYPTGYAGAYYLAVPEDGEGRSGSAPLVLPMRPPGEWQEFDVIWRGPRSEDGELVRRPHAVLFFNGVAVQVHLDMDGPTGFMDMYDFFDAHPTDDDGDLLEEVAFSLQDHGADDDIVHFRNVWYRELPDDPTELDDPYEVPEYDSDGIEWTDEDAEHDLDHEEHPQLIDPGDHGTTGEPPEDASLLIDDETVLEPGDGDWESNEDFGDCQVHLEWKLPADAEAMGPWRGNSGLQIGDYEIQLLDTDDNPVEPEEWAGAYTGEEPPHHDAVRASGEWQHLDLVFQGPRDDDAPMGGPAQVTALLNGVAVQTRLQIDEPNVDSGYDDLSVRLREPREGGSAVHVRNTWARSLVYDE